MADSVVKYTGLPVTEQEEAAAIAAVHDMLGPGQEVVSVEKNVCIREEEVLLVNGTPITLEGEEGQAIKDCLLRGSIPNQDLINHLLMKAGLLLRPVKVSTELNVKSSTTHSENVFLHKNGEILDENCKEKKEVNEYSSKVEEEWLPVNEKLTEAGKSLRDRLKSTDSVNVNDRLDTLCLKKGVTTSQDSLDIDRSFESVFNKSYDEKESVFNKSYDGSSASINSERSGSKSPHLVYKDGVILSGTLEELIHELVPRAHSTPPDSYLFSFLLSSRLYLTPSQLMGEVCRRADQLAHMMSTSSHPPFVSNLVRMLSHWMTWFPYDFQEEATMAKMRKLSQLCVARDSSVQSRVTQLLQSLLKHLTAVEKHKQYVAKIRKIQRESEDSIPVDLNSANWNPSMVAQQLTHVELQYLSFIGPDEFVNAFARDFNAVDKEEKSIFSSNLYSEAVEARLRAGKKTSNLESYISWFNRLSFLIGSSVCLHKKKKHRVRTIEFWIEVARECVNIGNFNSMMGIISGLNMNPVSRLKKTWTKIHSGKFDVLGHQMDPSSNFVSYRTTLQAAVSRSENATDKKQRVVIPFFSLLIKDLYFVNEGCASKLENGHINMEKARTLAEHISQFMKWKDMECPYEKISRVLDYFERSPTYSSDFLEFESYELEPPETPQEKDQYKELKLNFKKS